MPTPDILPAKAAESEAVDYMTANNADGAYTDLLARHAQGLVSVGILRFNGHMLPALRYEQNRLYNLLQQRPADRLDIDVEAVTRAHENVTIAIDKAEAAIAKPVIYALKKTA